LFKDRQNHSLEWEEQEDLAANGERTVQIDSSVCVLGVRFGGLRLAVSPIIGVFGRLGGMALLSGWSRVVRSAIRRQ